MSMIGCTQPVIPFGGTRAVPCDRPKESAIHPSGAYRYEGGEIGVSIQHEFRDDGDHACTDCSAPTPTTGRIVTAASLALAWQKYTHLFGEPPHGTEKQMAALLELV